MHTITADDAVMLPEPHSVAPAGGLGIKRLVPASGGVAESLEDPPSGGVAESTFDSPSSGADPSAAPLGEPPSACARVPESPCMSKEEGLALEQATRRAAETGRTGTAKRRASSLMGDLVDWPRSDIHDGTNLQAERNGGESL